MSYIEPFTLNPHTSSAPRLLVNKTAEQDLLGSIGKIRQRFMQQLSVKNLLDQQARTPDDLKEKLRNMSVVLQMISQENKTFYKQMQNYDHKIKSQQEQIDIKDQMIKKYREELLECRNKNMQLKNYNRAVANEYNILLNSIQVKQQLKIQQINAHKSKLHGLQGKVQYLRQRNRQISLKHIDTLKQKPYLRDLCDQQNIKTMKTQFTPIRKKQEKARKSKSKTSKNTKPRKISTASSARKSQFKLY